jgi:3-dehydroquinate synthase
MKTINLDLGSKSYDIIIQTGLLKNIGAEINKFYNNKKISIVTDSNVYNIYGSIIKASLEHYKYNINFIIVSPGEKSKSLEVLTCCYNDLIKHGITRSDLIIALGGGVIGDLAGFAAATYLRGINYVQIPTSLLAQIDSSIGGKVAVNLEQGKNLIGNFYQPYKVFIDPDVLNTLPDKYIKDGLGEVIKYACIKDPNLFEILMNIKSKDQLFNNIEYIIYTCCNIKKIIVEKDEHDNGERMLLNFGHTLGHAIEKYFNYEYSHGEAVSKGMYYITKKSEELQITEPGTAEEIKNILINFNIEYDIPNLDMDNIKGTIKLDKKNMSDKINLILIKKIGDAFIESISMDHINKYFGETI